MSFAGPEAGGGLPVVEVRGLIVRYGAVTAVAGVDLAVPAGGMTVLVGASGCGKTSLLRAVAGFEVPSAGEVLLEGRPVAGPGAWVPPERRRIGMVFQDGALFPHRTVEGNVLYGLAGEPRRRRRERVRWALDLVGMTAYAGRWPDQLSGGQQQRVALARALAPEPRLVLLDEPFASLDAELRVRLRNEVRAILAAAGVSAVLVTHDQGEALSLADTLVVMAAGRVVQSGVPEVVYERPASPAVATFLGEGQMVSCRVAGERLDTPFGEAPAPHLPSGPGHLLVRPEDLDLAVPGGAPGGVDGGVPRGVDGGAGARGVLGCPATLVRRQFFGHDVLEEIELAGGLRLQVRRFSPALDPVGTAVTVRLRTREYAYFPAAAPAGEPLSVRLPG